MIMRMAEVYLIAAEASVRLNKGDAAGYINVLRTRAGAGTVSESQVDLNYVSMSMPVSFAVSVPVGIC